MSTDARQSALISEHERRLAAIEWNLRRVMGAMQIAWEEPPPSNAFPPEVLDLLAQGQKLQAIQALMTRFGIKLTEAKEMIDRGHM